MVWRIHVLKILVTDHLQEELLISSDLMGFCRWGRSATIVLPSL